MDFTPKRFCGSKIKYLILYYMENNIIKYLLKCVRVLQIENAKMQYEYDYLLEYLDENNKYFDEKEDEDYLFKIKQFNDEIDSIRRED